MLAGIDIRPTISEHGVQLHALVDYLVLDLVGRNSTLNHLAILSRPVSTACSRDAQAVLDHSLPHSESHDLPLTPAGSAGHA